MDHDSRMREMQVLLELVMSSDGQEEAPDRDLTLAPETARLAQALDLPLAPGLGGPFSLANMLGVPAGRLSFLDGRSLGSAFADPSVTADQWRLVKNLGKLLLAPGFPAYLRVLGRSLYFLSAAAALVHRGESISSLTAEEFEQGVDTMRRHGGLDRRLAALADRARARIQEAV